jgi:hypothetical protein
MLAHLLESDDPGWLDTDQHPELLAGEPRCGMRPAGLTDSGEDSGASVDT